MSNRKRASSPVGDAQQGAVRKTAQDAGPSHAAAAAGDDDIGEWEDRYEDEYESEDIITDDEEDEDDEEETEYQGGSTVAQTKAIHEASNKVGQMELDGQQDENDDDGEAETLPYLPQLGQGSKELAEDEELVPDMSSYVLLHHARLAWPCLSFDVLRDVSSSDHPL